MGLARVTFTAQLNHGVSLARLDRVEEARRLLTDVTARLTSQPDPRHTPLAHIYVAQVELGAGDLVAAERSARTAHAQLAPLASPQYDARGTLGLILCAAGRAAEAVELLREPPRHRVVLTDSQIGPHVHYLAEAEARVALGDPAGARAAIARAREWVETAAAKISDPGLRESYVRGVPLRVRVLETHARLG
jgi:hypothetical protein